MSYVYIQSESAQQLVIRMCEYKPVSQQLPSSNQEQTK